MRGLLSFFILALACAPEGSPDPPSSVALVLAAAERHHGDLRGAGSMRFRKTTTLYDSTGAVEAVSDRRYVVLVAESHAGTSVVSQDAAPLPPHDTLSPTRGSPAAFFAATLPWRLRDAGAEVRHTGDTTRLGRRLAVCLAVTYPATPDADAFAHYFDVTTGRHLGYGIDHPGPDDALVVNERDTIYRGLRLPVARTTYRLRGGDTAFARARYRYDYY